MRSSPKENQSLEVKVKGISEMEFSLSIFDYTFTNYQLIGIKIGSTELSMVKIAQTLTRHDLARIFIKSNLSKTQALAKSGFHEVNSNTLA